MNYDKAVKTFFSNVVSHAHALIYNYPKERGACTSLYLLVITSFQLYEGHKRHKCYENKKDSPLK